MSIMYCMIPHFAVALAQRDQPDLAKRPLVLLGPQERVLDASAEAAACGISAGLTAHMARVRCPEARLLDTDVVYCREMFETLLDTLDQFSPTVEPHGLQAAYVDLGDLVRSRDDAISFCGDSGRMVRKALGDTLQPALGWNQSKFTAQAAARHTRPGRLLTIDAAYEHDFLGPLPVTLLPLTWDTLQRLAFLGLRTLNQYAALPAAAVWQQFGQAGKRAHRYARGQDDRPVISRHRMPTSTADHDFEVPCVARTQVQAALRRRVAPLLNALRGNLQACGQVCLTVRFDDGSAAQRTRTFFVPTTERARVERALDDLMDGMDWPTGAISLSVSLGQIQDAVMEQLSLFPAENAAEIKLHETHRYLSLRFGASHLWRTALIRPGAPLAEWRAGWQREEEE